MTILNVIFIIAVSQMYVEKPIVKKDSYVGDAKIKTVHFLTRGGFRFRSTEKERVEVRTVIYLTLISLHRKH